MFSSILPPDAIISTWQMKNQRLTVGKEFAKGRTVCKLELNPKLSGSQFYASSIRLGKNKQILPEAGE